MKGIVCLTGDVHHMSLKTRDQSFLRRTEANAAEIYAKICEKNGIQATLFLTGKLISQEKKTTNTLAEMDHLELGGHGFDGFQPRIFYKLSYRLLGRKNGPRIWQRQQVGKTLRLLESLKGDRVLSWRNHALRHDINTPEILREFGIEFWSDIVKREEFAPYYASGLVCVPINTIMDHDTMVHGRQTKKSMAVAAQQGKIAKRDICSPEEWLNKVLCDVDAITQKGGVATILAHPACMEIANGFETFKTLCNELKALNCLKMGSLPRPTTVLI